MVPGDNSTCVIEQGYIASFGCEVSVPHDVNNNPVGRVRWHRSLDLVTSEEVTAAADKYVISLHSSELVSTGDFTGLYKDLYVLSIINISSSDNGYYWCQIISDQTCLSPSPYVNISVVTATKDKCSFTYQPSSPVCAVMTNVTCDHQSSEVTISPTATQAMLSSLSVNFSTPIATTSSSPESDGQQTVHDVTSHSPNKNGPVHLAVIVAVPAAAFVVLLVSLLVLCAGIYMCQRKARKRKGK